MTFINCVSIFLGPISRSIIAKYLQPVNGARGTHQLGDRHYYAYYDVERGVIDSGA